ncbi:HIT family protein [Campylobacter vulpis]|uniref:HIT domain-containing protein n=1 Tax=Campylobacter vulpis TaxID=1655500 RepID=A0ABS5P2T0_9BACT|nr:HIT domain-containing protein [Campylobacter vulpis]MBS4240454.1 HIT domain-containing protein [Campylobacter vulpis]MBS4251788.1 HIT domain-containing protein [Campylobacter vulpis]MBS4275177.1 HIT domain-containing protein [Campylobacter vulpis]MBS4281435.1 HIT domain-containing protein [Campylobacter vulpis]MBS4306253.1 HIT domain-containing protein [Campylobacter vulpis]
MEHLYAPWRSEYLEEKSEFCPFCVCAKKLKSDEELGVLFRARHCFGVMNRYPYTPGHFMIIPYKHEEHIENLSEEEWGEMSLFVRKGVKILKEHLKASGVNIGMNLSVAAGAGIASHCHYHLVPRWRGDTNFITSIGQTRVCGADLEKMYQKLFKAFNARGA